MRQLNPVTNIILACAAALGLVMSMSLPWYAPTVVLGKADLTQVAEGDADGPMQDFSHWIQRVFSHGGKTYSGNAVLGASRTLIVALAVLTAVLCLVMLVEKMRPVLRDFVRAVALVTPVIVVALAFHKPGHVELEIRWGLIVAVLLGLFMASCAWQAGTLPKKKVAAVRPATRFSN